MSFKKYAELDWIQSIGLSLICLVFGIAAGWFCFRHVLGCIAGSGVGIVIANMLIKMLNQARTERCRQAMIRWMNQWVDLYAGKPWNDRYTIDHFQQSSQQRNGLPYELIDSLANRFRQGHNWDNVWTFFRSYFGFPEGKEWTEGWFRARSSGKSILLAALAEKYNFRMEVEAKRKQLLSKSRIELSILILSPYVFLLIFDSMIPQYIDPLFSTSTGHFFMGMTWTFTILTTGLLTSGPAFRKNRQPHKPNTFFSISISPKWFKRTASNQEYAEQLWSYLDVTERLICGTPWMNIFPDRKQSIPAVMAPVEVAPHDQVVLNEMVHQIWRQFVVTGRIELLHNLKTNLKKQIQQLHHRMEAEAMKTQMLYLLPALFWLIWLCVLLAFPSWMEIRQTWRM